MIGYLALICGALLGGILAYFQGHKAGKRDEAGKANAENLDAIRKAKEVNNAVDQMDGPHINASIDRWVRDKKR